MGAAAENLGRHGAAPDASRGTDDEIERFRRLLSRLPVPVHEVAYEDLLARRDDVLGALSDFLGVPAPPRTLRSKVVPTVPSRTVDLDQNRDAVRAALAGLAAGLLC